MSKANWIAAAVLALGASTLASPASAGTIAWAGQYTYMGEYFNFPDEPFTTTVAHEALLNDTLLAGTGEIWIFKFAPVDGVADFSINFNPDEALLNFGGSFHAIGDPTSCTVGSTCTGVDALNAGNKITDFYSVSSGIGFVRTLTAGYYALRITGELDNSFANYSGQISFERVPEPGSLALLGLGVVGLGLAGRRRKAS